MGRLAALYESGNDVAATETSNSIANKITGGTEPASAITETSIPEQQISFDLDQMSGETEPFSPEELEVKTLPRSIGDTTIPVEDGMIGLLQEPTLPGELVSIPGLLLRIQLCQTANLKP
jgi:hypothetical protein